MTGTVTVEKGHILLEVGHPGGVLSTPDGVLFVSTTANTMTSSLTCSGQMDESKAAAQQINRARQAGQGPCHGELVDV